MNILDLFCGAGGAADGYIRAHEDAQILGIDNALQPYYPYDFMMADAFTALAYLPLERFDLIHASPPCQAYSYGVRSASSPHTTHRGKDEPRLIATVRDIISPYPYVIENVMGAKKELINPILLCGSMFGLHIPRHRLFETNQPIPQPDHPDCDGMAMRYAQELGLDRRDVAVSGKGRNAGTSELWSRLLDINRVMRQEDYTEAIPPAYTEYIGQSL